MQHAPSYHPMWVALSLHQPNSHVGLGLFSQCTHTLSAEVPDSPGRGRVSLEGLRLSLSGTSMGVGRFPALLHGGGKAAQLQLHIFTKVRSAYNPSILTRALNSGVIPLPFQPKLGAKHPWICAIISAPPKSVIGVAITNTPTTGLAADGEAGCPSGTHCATSQLRPNHGC